MPDFICQYGNCEKTDTLISINYRKQERPRFCCESHAALWLMRRASLNEYDRFKKAWESTLP